ncbi:MAG: type II toxin-antitoxin system HipA family toxin [Herbiconiux sp.]|uniref:HipA domain-containing protein n=1 Tax=Herbiconiux sp. TaxID=1871186 RepID=UPI00120755D2|nr:HipA domain-containing protein [Herbiconiux sp.]TAJ46449.1 MAG: type II toxin-antitoxin system HipA family toxin [Herbiconiux sp.]
MSDLEIYLDGVECGVVTQTSTGNITFHYDESYRRTQRTPLSLSMPLAASTHKKRAILPYLQGLLPDSEDALTAIARRYSVSAKSPVALLSHIGSDVAGAVQIVVEQGTSTDATLSRSDIRPVDDAEVGRMLRHVMSEYSEGVPYYDSVGHFSLAGAQPKIALHKDVTGGWNVPQDATPTTHILKPVAGTVRRIDVVEQVTMQAARVLGSQVAKSDLETIDGVDVFVSERYDRRVVDGEWRRLHQEDLCQALSVPPDKKYQHRDGGPGLAVIAGLIRSLPLERDRREAGRAFYQAFVFNVVAGCTDAHAKNYSLMLDGESVRLAPLYDLVTSAPYWNGEAGIDSAMSVNGEYAFARIGAEMLSKAGKQFGVGDEAADIVAATREGIFEAFESAVEGLPESVKNSRDIVDDLFSGLRALPLVIS